MWINAWPTLRELRIVLMERPNGGWRVPTIEATEVLPTRGKKEDKKR
jgi:hypothetical protein